MPALNIKPGMKVATQFERTKINKPAIKLGCSARRSSILCRAQAGRKQQASGIKK